MSILLGNFVALAQSNVRRLLAYSAVAHGGYTLLGIVAGGRDGFSAALFYITVYAVALVGAFAVVGMVKAETGGDDLPNFAGLSARSPLLAGCMSIFMLSLAGLPPLAGFFGKFYLFTAAIGTDPKNLGLLWLIAFAIAMSAVSLYYYLQVLKQIYVVQVHVENSTVAMPLSSKIVVVLMALGVVLLGCAPNLLVGRLLAAINPAAQ